MLSSKVIFHIEKTTKCCLIKGDLKMTNGPIHNSGSSVRRCTETKGRKYCDLKLCTIKDQKIAVFICTRCQKITEKVI
jgi:hypothetical protein